MIPGRYKINEPADKKVYYERNIERLQVLIAEKVFVLDVINEALQKTQREYAEYLSQQESPDNKDCEVVLDKLTETN